MSATETAVRTLTATVRSIAVDNRQITLSVARQLDTIPLEHLDVWGRVRVHKSEHHVIGADTRTGDLALARYTPKRAGSRPPTPHLLELPPDAIRLCRRAQPSFGTTTIHLRLEGVDFDVDERQVQRACLTDRAHDPSETCGFNVHGITEDTLRDEITAELELVKTEFILDQKASRAPLIVLAGLK